jgi:hypothetical protein
MAQNITKSIIIRKLNWKILAGCGLVLLIAAHGIVAAGLVKWSGKIGGGFPWIGGGALLAFGLYHVIRAIRSKGYRHSYLFGGHAPDREAVERGPHDGILVNLGHGFVEVAIFGTDMPPRFRLFFLDQRKQARSVPRNATVKIETVRPDGARQAFDFHAIGEYLESTTEIPEPREFKAIIQVSHGSHTHSHEVLFSEHGPAHVAGTSVKMAERLRSRPVILFGLVAALITGPLILFYILPYGGVPRVMVTGIVLLMLAKHLGLLAVLLGPLYAVLHRRSRS